MRNLIVILIVLNGILAIDQKPNQSAAKLISARDSIKSAKELAFNNKTLDLDFVKASKESKHSDGDIAMGKAIVYRFYKHVHIVNGYYFCDLTDAKEIHISERAYWALLNDMNKINGQVKTIRAKGQTVPMHNPSVNYFNSLIK